MDLGFFLRGLLIGFSIAASVGPIWVLVMRRTLAYGSLPGLVSGMGVATADGLYGAIGGFGLTFVSSLLVEQSLWLRLIGGGFMCYLGIKIGLSAPVAREAKDSGGKLSRLYISTFLLTLTNPMTIISFAVILAGLGAGSTNGNYLATLILILGVFCGSSVWWVVMTSLLGMLHKKITPRIMRWINWISGFIIFAFGVVALLTLLQ
ncbi:LysE family transporter [Candidatus Chlorohelix sp.]|uniref:LysE family translocator n=1 Tax=Candidatus Chlorohelix sp. TaxID=3139201 RepID=UPI00306008CC